MKLYCLLGPGLTLLTLGTWTPASAETYETSLIRFVLPGGWVRVPSSRAVTWTAFDDPAGARCAVSLLPTQFDKSPAKSFTLGWNGMTFAARNRLAAPPPTVQPLPGGYTLARGSWVGPVDAMPRFYFGIGNVARADAGHMLVAAGGAPDCGATFSRLLNSVVILDAPATEPGSKSMAQSMGEFYRDRNEADRRMAEQRARDQQAQDRLAQQREFDRQAQNRLMPQRIQDSYRR